MKYFITFALAALAAISSHSQSLIPSTISTNSTIEALELDGNILYLGGSFTEIGLTNRFYSLIPLGSDQSVQDLIYPNSSVEVTEPDGSGGWYIGGNFTSINGTSVGRVAHILSDQTIDPNFSCTVNSTVAALAIDGDQLYLGGSFTVANGIDVNRIIRVDKNTGVLDATWTPTVFNGSVNKIVVTPGKVHAGGTFFEANSNTDQQYYSVFAEADGAQIPSYSVNSTVQDMHLDGDNLYLGGNFNQAGTYKAYLNSFTDGNSFPDFNFPDANSTILTIEPDGSGGYYMGGSFTAIGSETQNRLAHILADGTIDPSFNVSVNSTVHAIRLDGSSDLYIGGSFTQINGDDAIRVARLDAATGALDATWAASPNSTVQSIDVNMTQVLIGGSFTEISGSDDSRYFAALDKSTGAALKAQSTNSTVNSIKSNTTNTYMGGSFSQTGFYQPYMQRLSASDDTPDYSFPDANSTVNHALPDGAGGWYVAGSFNQINNQSATRVAHILADNTLDLDFNCDPNSTVNIMHIDGNFLYLGGSFSSINNNTATRVARVSKTTGVLDATWLPTPNSTVNAISTDANNVYVGGSFSEINNSDNSQYFASLSKNTGLVYPTRSPNSTVTDIESNGSDIFISGSYSSVGFRDLYLSKFSGGASVPDFSQLNPNSPINDVIPDGNGGYYAAGSFTQVDGQNTSRIAHFLSDGTLDTDFSTNINSTVEKILLNGNDLYAAGSFSTVDGAGIQRLAKLNATTGAVDTDFTPNPNSTVNALAFSGSTLYFGGSFTTIGTETRNRLAAVGTDGAVLPWNPDANSTVNAMTVSNGNVYISGSFTTIGGVAKQRMAALNPSTGALTSFDAGSINSTVETFLIDGSTLYIGGSFTSINGNARNRFASLNTTTGALNPLTISIENGSVNALAVSGTNLAIGGTFTLVDGNSRARFIEVTASTGAPTARTIDFNSTISTIAYVGSDLLVGGSHSSVNEIQRGRLAEFDLNTADFTDFSVDGINSTINDMELSGSTLYIGGSFTTVAGQSRRIAGIALSDGSLTALNPTLNSTVNSLKVDGTTLYFGGSFTEVNTTGRQRAAAVTISTGALTDWDPSFNGTVENIAIDGSDILATGSFTYSKTNDTGGLAVYDPQENLLDNVLSTNINGTINTLLLEGNMLYAGGSFTTFDGQPRQRLAQYNLSTETVMPLSLTINSTVNSIGKLGDDLYFGGSFTDVSGLPRGRAALYDLGTASLSDWNPNFNSTVEVIAPSMERVLIGGSFTVSNFFNSNDLIAFDVETGEPSILLDVSINGTINALEIKDNDLFIGGTFTNISGESRQRVASLNKTTGVLNPFSANINTTVNDLEIVGDDLYVVGSFTEVGGNDRLRGAAFDITTGTLTDFDPAFNSTVNHIATDGSSLSFGGNFTLGKTLMRQHIAAIDLSNDEVLLFGEDATINGTVRAIAFDDENIFVGGSFSSAGDVTRNRVAAFSKADGTLTAFDPNISGSTVNAMHVDGGNLYIGGSFNSVSGSTRSNLASVQISTGMLNPFDLPTNSAVNTIEIGGGIVYFGGSFSTVNGSSRGRLAAANTTTGALTSFDGLANSTVETLRLDGTLLYAGGSFSNIGGATRQRLAALSTIDASLNTWAPALNSTVLDIDITENYLFAAGSFTTLDGDAISRLVLLDKNTGENLFNFAPELNSTALAVRYFDEKVYAGGFFSIIGANYANSNLAQFNIPAPGTSSFTAILESTTDINGFDIACNGQSTGEIEISVSGGTGPYSYTLTNTASLNRTGSIANASATATESNLPAGNYTINISDADDGVAIANIAITQPTPAFNATLTLDSPVETVDGTEAAISISIAGGVAPFDYSFSAGGSPTAGSILSSGSSTLIENLGAGTYNFEFTDANGCTEDASIQINDYALVTLQFTEFDNITCNGDEDGRLRIVATNGIPPYTYVLDADDDSFDRNGTLTFSGSQLILNDLGPATYNLAVTDATGAEYTAGPVTLEDPELLTASIAVAGQPSALGANDGEISLSIIGGNPNYTYTVNRDGSNITSGNTANTSTLVSNRNAGTYFFTVTDANGCQITTNTIELIAGTDPCAALGGDTDSDGSCDDNDPCPLLANLENGDNCGTNGTVVNCECVEECNLTLGTPVVTCSESTAGDDDYTVTIFYSGSAPGATLSVTGIGICDNADIIISGDDPATNFTGTIVLTANESADCWGLSITSGLCDLVITGAAPSCSPGLDCPDLGLNNGDACGTNNEGTVVNCECLIPDCNGDLGGTVVDTDNDGICDDVDNCIASINPSQEDLDMDGEGDICDDDIDGDGLVNADDCDPLDATITTSQIWYVDADGDGFGTDEMTLEQCTEPDGYADNADDCDDTNAAINPGAQTLTFTGTGAFVNSVISPLIGSPSTSFQFSVVFTDATGALPPLGYPRALLDYEGNGVFNNANDRAILLTPADASDLNTVDGKTYIGSINSLVSGTNYELSVQALANGCLTEIGPFDQPDVLTEPDLEIFADDITFSDINPDVDSEITVTAVFRNVSDLPAVDFSVGLSSQYDPNESFPNITVPFLGAGDETSVSWLISTPEDPAWVPMKVFVDNTNVILETNELDNTAVRPYVNGDFEVPGTIVVDPNASPTIQAAATSASVNISGFAVYEGTAIELEDPSVAGASVSFGIDETGASYTTTTNSQGYFSLGVVAPTTPGVYTVTGEITDFTLSGTFTVTFEIVEPVCLPDLSTQVFLSDNQIFVGETIDGSITVTNIGCLDVTVATLLDVSQTGGSPMLADQMVPPLAVGESFTFNFTDVSFDQIGSYSICGYADSEFIVEEQSEGNNYRCRSVQVVPALPDLVATNGPSGSAFLCNNPQNPSFGIRNSGYVPSGEFDYEIDILYDAILQETATGTMANLNPNQTQSITVPYVFADLGSYTFQLRVDVPLPNGQVTEISEANNIGNYAYQIVECKPDLQVLTCGKLEVDPVDPENPGTVTYTAMVRNIGNATALAPIAFNFTLSNGEIYELTYDQDIAPSETVEFSTSAPSVPSGTALLAAIVDPADEITEFSESNNQYSDSLCWDFAAVPKCGTNFWNRTYIPFSIVNLSVGLDNNFLYKASEVKVRFEISGPGIDGTALLGDAIVQNVNQTCGCPYVAVLPTNYIFNQIGTYTFTITADPDGEYSECNESNNVLVRDVQVSSLPDMRVLSEFINPTLLNPDLGESTFFDITYENIGVSNIDDEMDLAIFIDEIPFSVVENVPGLINGQNNTIAFPMPYATNLGGSHIVRAIIDSNSEIEETNELNNEATRAIVVGSAANLFFDAFIPSDPSPAIGDEISIDATIGNNGDLDVDADVLFKYINNGGNEVQIGSVPVSIVAGGSQDISLTWTVLDNNTLLLGEIVNASEIEFNYADNFASAPLSTFDLAISTEAFCEADDEGSLTANASNGAEPYTYSWSTGFVGQTLVAAPGTYTVTATDANGEEATANGTIAQNPECVPQVCSLSAVSFNVAPSCDAASGLYSASLVLAYANAPSSGFIEVNGDEFAITGSPQTFDFQLGEGAVIFNANFTEESTCALTVMTGVTLAPCEQDCAGTFGGSATIDDCGVCDANPANDNLTCLDCEGVPNGDALPGTPCTNAAGQAGVYGEDCNCDVDTEACSIEVVSFTSSSDPCVDTAPELAVSLGIINPNQETELAVSIDYESEDIDDAVIMVAIPVDGGSVDFLITLAQFGVNVDVSFALGSAAEACSATILDQNYPTCNSTDLSLLELECGAFVIQVTGAQEGLNDGGTATAATRTVYTFIPDNANGIPTYTGSSWPYVISVGSLTIDPAITAMVTTNEDGVILINGWPIYQFANDADETTTNGTFGPWNYILPDGTLSQNACEVVFDCEELEANIGDACDDGDDSTENDTVTEDCECIGTPVFECEADGGAIEFADGSTSVSVCVDDNDPSNVSVAFATAPDAPEGYGATWVVTDADGNLLGLPATAADVAGINFDDAGAGNCLIWFLSFEADNSNVAAAAASFAAGDDVNAADLTGCFELSNSIEVLRENCNVVFDCEELGANIGDPCDDGDADTENDVVTDDCGCEGTPVVVTDCNNFVYYMADVSAESVTSIYSVTIAGGDANLSLLKTLDYEAHIAFNVGEGLLYVVRSVGGSFATLDVSVVDGAMSAETTLDLPLTKVTAAAFNADDKLVLGDDDSNMVRSVNADGTSSLYTSAAVSGGDLAFSSTSGIAYLASRASGGKLFQINPGMAGQIGTVSAVVTGLAIMESGNLLYSAKNAGQLTGLNADGTANGVAFDLVLDGEPFTSFDGDLAAGCGDNIPDNAPCYAAEGDELLEYIPGTRADGTPLVDPLRTNPLQAVGAPQGDMTFNFVSLGYGGQITLGFTGGSAINGPGDDILVRETTFGNNTFATYPESAEVFVSQDGVNFFSVGTAETNENATFDIDAAGQGFTSIIAVRLVDNTPIGSISDDGYDLDGIMTLNGCGPAPLVETGSCYASELVAYSPGLQTDGAAIAADRNNPNVALGAPDQGNAAGGFVSLGVGGSLTLGFSGQVTDGPGDDILIFETSFSGDVCSGAGDERAVIAVSQDGGAFVNVGTICRDGGVDISTSGLAYVTQVRITNAASTASLDGYDVDGVIAVYNCEDGEGDDEDQEGLRTNGDSGTSVLASYPNPTQGVSNVVFTTAQTTRTTVAVFDMNGRNVTTLFNQVAQEGQEYRLNFDGAALPNGVYIYRLTTMDTTIMEKFMIAK